MGDFHFGVIDDVRKVVRRKAVGFNQYKIINYLWTGVHLAHDFVVPGVSFRF